MKTLFNATTVHLSHCEKELLRLIVAGKTTVGIANSMCLGIETIKSYRKYLIFKMNVGNSVELSRIAIEEKLV